MDSHQTTEQTTPSGEACKITYTSDQLRQLNSGHYKITRPVRKELFANNIWKPRCNINYFDIISGSCKSNLIQCHRHTSDPQNTPQLKEANGLVYGLLNARSINNKIEEITDTIISNNLDLLAITETWVTESSTNHAIVQILQGLQNYSHFSQTRTDRRGGGICIFYKDNFKVSKNINPAFPTFELLDVTIKLNSESLRLATFYRPPNSAPSDFLTEFSTYLETVLTTNSTLLLCGDFNIHVDNPKCSFARNFMDIISTSGLHQHISERTHRSGHTLDLIISRSEENHLLTDFNVFNTTFSDHSLIKTKLSVNKPQENSTYQIL